MKEQFAKRLITEKIWAELGAEKPFGKTLQRWISKRVGTAHTSQGKEEDTVIMLLGADKQREGAARWAASRPNILNVALTRAKRRFYLVGDRQIWGKLRFFQDAYRDLPVTSAERFSDQAGLQWKRKNRQEQIQVLPQFHDGGFCNFPSGRPAPPTSLPQSYERSTGAAVSESVVCN